MAGAATTTRDFLRQMVESIRRLGLQDWNGYLGSEDFVLKNGRIWKPRALPLGIKVGLRKQCFGNALVLGNSGYRYVEGYALGGDVPFPCLHAWAADDEGHVIDNTWTGGERPGLGIEYFGVDPGVEVFMAPESEWRV